MCGTTYFTLNSGRSRGNITLNKWERSSTSPFSIVLETPIMMYVITIDIKTLEMTWTNRSLER